jgi:negative regulator of sigma E activity
MNSFNNGCNEVQSGLSEYLDGRLSGREMQEIDAHLQECFECARESKSLRELQASLASLGPVPEPADLPLRVRVAVSQERARKRRRIFTAWELAWKNTVGPFLLQAGAGFASAVVLLGTVVVLVTVFAQPQAAQATPDEPLGDATAPHLLYFSNAQGNNDSSAISGPVVVEAYVNNLGEVYDYRIVSGPTDAATRSQVENMLLFSRFEPARFFGQPVRGLAVLSFSGVSVRG